MHIGWAWLGLTMALHVTDEALNDFLSIYNPQAEAIREQLPWLPIPTFSLPNRGGLTASLLE